MAAHLPLAPLFHQAFPARFRLVVRNQIAYHSGWPRPRLESRLVRKTGNNVRQFARPTHERGQKRCEIGMDCDSGSVPGSTQMGNVG